MKKIFQIISFIIIFSPGISIGQNVFSNVYVDMNGYTEVHSGANSCDGGYVLAGYHEDEMMILRLDSIGNMLWKRAIENNYDNNTGMITSTRDSCYIVVGNFYDNNKSINYIQAVKFNDSGDTLWAYGYKLDQGKVPSSVTSTNDGGFIISCNHSVIGPSIIKINESGALEWAKNYICGFLDYASDIIQTTDSAYIICGNTNENAFLLKIDLQGDTIWSRSYFSENNSWTRAYNLEYLDNSIFTIFLTDDDCLLVKLDNSGNIIWSKYLFTYYNSWYPRPYEGFIIKKDLYSDLIVVTPPFAYLFDIAGEIKWVSYYELWKTDVIPCIDKGGLVIGNGPIPGVDNSIYNQTHIGVYKTDSTGVGEYCIGPTMMGTSSYELSDTSIMTYIEETGTLENLNPEINDFPLWIDPGCVTMFSNTEERDENKEIMIFPNPAKDHLNISIENFNKDHYILKIYDSLGRLHKTHTVTEEKTRIQLQEFLNGIYFLFLESNNKIISKQKFIIAR